MPEKITHAATFARIAELDKEGLSQRKIAEILEAEGFPQLSNRKKWSHSGVSWCLEQIDRRAGKSAPDLPSSPLPSSAVPPKSAPHPKPPLPQPPPAPEPKSDTIDIHGPYTVEDRRLWELLLRLPGPDLDPTEIHQLPVSTVLDTLGLDQDQLTPALDRLTCTRMKWVSVRPPGLTVLVPLLASVTQSGNTLSFYFAPHLMKLLKNGKEFARLQIALEANAGMEPF